MPFYQCPKCGRTVEVKAMGEYTCKLDGTKMRPVEAEAIALPTSKRLTREQFDKNWSWGAEPAAAIPGEPIEFYKADRNLENAEAIVVGTDDGKYYIRFAHGAYIRNPKTNTTLFDTIPEAKNEYYKNLIGSVLTPETIGELMRGISEAERLGQWERCNKLKDKLNELTRSAMGKERKPIDDEIDAAIAEEKEAIDDYTTLESHLRARGLIFEANIVHEIRSDEIDHRSKFQVMKESW